MVETDMSERLPDIELAKSAEELFKLSVDTLFYSEDFRSAAAVRLLNNSQSYGHRFRPGQGEFIHNLSS